MTHGPEHHIEHAEHASHAAHDHFNRQVTMSIAIVAAVLACVTMLGHRAHNDTLRLQGEALDLQTQASIKSTKAANKWAYYQSKNTFAFQSEMMLDLLKVMAMRDGTTSDAREVVERYETNAAYYTGDKDNRMSRRTKGKKSETEKTGKLKSVEEEGKKLDEEAEALLKKSESKLEESHVVHERANRFDYGELGLQFGVVLCSLAILMKSRAFWVVGIVSAAVGAAVAVSGFFIAHH